MTLTAIGGGEIMKQWLVFLVVSLGCSGCTLMEELMFDGPPHYGGGPMPLRSVEQPVSSCNNPIMNVSASQTAEPELLHAK